MLTSVNSMDRKQESTLLGTVNFKDHLCQYFNDGRTDCH